MEDITFDLEKKHLSVTVKKLQNAKKDLDNAMEALGAGNLDRLKELRDNPETSGTDYLMYVQQLHEKNEAFNLKDKVKRLEEISYLTREPYFARIDLEEPKNPQDKNELYIGKFGYTEDKPVITDWRAKIASVYYRYRYPQKNVFYDAPDGRIAKDLTLKRTYEIDDSVLLKYFNNDLQLDENEIITGKLNERTGGVLEDIIETIQESQLDIIEADPRKVCIVQGCVGSGKSTVAIHKLSHIFFNFPKIIQPERSILVAKSGILISYLATLFPKLGIFDVNYKTLRELVYGLLFSEDVKLQFDLDINLDLSEFDSAKIKKLQKDIKEVHKLATERIKKLLEDDTFASLASYAHDDSVSIKENMEDLLAELNEELAYQKERLKENPNSVKSWIFKENIQNLRKLTNRLQTIRADLRTKYLVSVCNEWGLDLSAQLGYREILLYLYIHSRLFGLPNSLKYQYCVVDEGQDLNVLEYLVLSQLVQHGRFCILGDLNQSYVVDGLDDWGAIKDVVSDAKDAQTFELDTNYRSTKQIIDFANDILRPYTQSYLPKSINRMGVAVLHEPAVTNADKLVHLEKHLRTDLEKLDKSIGIIVFGDSLLVDVQNLLDSLSLELHVSDEKIIKLEDHTRIAYIPKGVYVSKFENCKGLEFSKVYVLGMNLDAVSNFDEAKKAFVAVTRAMNELVIIGE